MEDTASSALESEFTQSTIELMLAGGVDPASVPEGATHGNFGCYGSPAFYHKRYISWYYSDYGGYGGERAQWFFWDGWKWVEERVGCGPTFAIPLERVRPPDSELAELSRWIAIKKKYDDAYRDRMIKRLFGGRT